MERYVGNIRLVEYDILLKHREVYAFSTYRQGGVSTGAYASLNCTPYVGDDPQCVRQNQEILLNTLPHRPRELVIPWQTHGTDILTVDEDWLVATPERRHHLLQGIDAMITDKPGVCLCVSTADCIPILLYDHVHRVIAAVHAGWRGTVNFLVLRTLRRMHMHAIATYDPCAKKHHIDLPEANAIQMKYFGMHEDFIEDCRICTYRRHEDFFSARRLGAKSGRILSGIMLKNI